MIIASKPTGGVEQNIINMAVAIHNGEVTCRDYKYMEYNPLKWINYPAWLVLRNTKKFSHPIPDDIFTHPPTPVIAPPSLSLSLTTSTDSGDSIEGEIEGDNEMEKETNNIVLDMDMYKQVGQKQPNGNVFKRTTPSRNQKKFACYRKKEIE